MLKIVEKIVKGICVLFACSLFYLAFMSLMFTIPATGAVNENIGDSLNVWICEDYSEPLYLYDAFYIDTTSDMIWANLAATNTDSPIKNAIKLVWHEDSTEDSSGKDIMAHHLIGAVYYQDAPQVYEVTYSRYWMLIAGVIRALFLVMTIREIRFLLFTIAGIVISAVVIVLYRELGWRGTVPFITAVVMRLWMLNAVSISLFSDVFVTCIALLVLLLNHEKKWFKDNKYIFYLVIGSFTFANGPLVAPIMPLGMTLIADILLSKPNDSKLASWLDILKSSFIWLAGYAGTMLIKSVLAFFVMGKEEASASFPYYMGLGQDISVRFYRIWYCMERLLAPMIVKVPLLIILLTILTIIAIKNGLQKHSSLFQLLAVSIYPIVWVFILVEHSLHNFATNIYSILVFGILCAFTFSIKPKDL